MKRVCKLGLNKLKGGTDLLLAPAFLWLSASVETGMPSSHQSSRSNLLRLTLTLGKGAVCCCHKALNSVRHPINRINYENRQIS